MLNQDNEKKIVCKKSFLRYLGDFMLFLKEALIFKDFSRRPTISNYFFKPCEHCYNFFFDLIVYVPVNNFWLCWDGSSWVESILSKD